MYKLIIEDDEGKTTVVPLIRDEITIGRKEGNTIRLTERNVSRRHAKLLKSNGSVVIEDLQSYNGIRLNGDRINGRATVGEGDRIQIGDYQLALKLDKANTADKAGAGVPDRMPEDDATTRFDKDADGQTAMSPVAKADESPARVVVVSSNFAGRMFILDKAAVVIGRTDENDVVINHRSISRHHAKIVREGGHYHVVDLQSANGVRVNGEEYGKVELRKGDHIDLGHVRLRFIAPGEDFLFERDAKIVEVTGDKRGKGGLYAMIGVAVLLLGIGAIAVVKLMGGKGGPEKQSVDVEGQIAKINLDVDNAMKALDWDKAIGLCRDGLSKDPSADTLRDKKTRAEAEKRNEEKFTEYSRAGKEGDYDRAVTAYQELPEDSFYHDKAQETYNGLKQKYIKEHLARAQNAQKSNQCEEARKHVEAVLLVDEANQDAQTIAQRCGQTPIAPKRPHEQKPHEQKPPKEHPQVQTPQHVEETPPPPKETPKASSAEGDEAYNAAMNEYVKGNYSAASEKARRAIGLGNSKGWRLVGASGCFQHNRDDAVKAWNKLGQMDRQFIKYVCSRNNITIP